MKQKKRPYVSEFNCFKIATRINLKSVAGYFGFPWPASGMVEYIVLDGYQLEGILKYDTSFKAAYIFEFGCITLVNFDTIETGIFINFIESITLLKMNSEMMFKYNEVYKAYIDRYGYFKINEENDVKILYGRNVEIILAVVLAKSVALSKVEWEVDVLMDQAEKYVDYLQKGLLHTHSKRFSIITAQILRFGYESIYNIEILDRINGMDKNIKLREFYDRVSEYYELNERFNILKNKVENLKRITKAYTKLSYERNESRLYFFEIFLLILFPLSYLFRYFIS